MWPRLQVAFSVPSLQVHGKCLFFCTCSWRIHNFGWNAFTWLTDWDSAHDDILRFLKKRGKKKRETENNYSPFCEDLKSNKRLDSREMSQTSTTLTNRPLWSLCKKWSARGPGWSTLLTLPPKPIGSQDTVWNPYWLKCEYRNVTTLLTLTSFVVSREKIVHL